MNKENEDNDDYMNISDDDDDNGNMIEGISKEKQTKKEDNKDKDNHTVTDIYTGNIFDTIVNEIKESMIQTEHQQIKQELNNEGFCIVENNVILNHDEDNWEIISNPKK